MRKIIFLDFDGVMDTAFYDHFALKNGLPETDEYGCVFDPNCIMALNEIVKKTGASIVVSSTWKDFMTMEQLMKMWEDRCLPGEVVDVTPSIIHHRGDEIDAWLKEYGKPCQYVIIDDLPFSEFNLHHQSHFIMTNGFDGLNDDLAERAIRILNKDVVEEDDNNKVLIIPDVHCRTFWRIARDMVNDYEKVIFLGDYLDPYEHEYLPIERGIEDFLDIIEFKKENPDKVVLLLGNHDLHYWWDDDMDCSRRDLQHLGIVHRLMMMNRECFQLAYRLETPHGEYLFTHAGVLKEWLKDNIEMLPEKIAEDIENISCELMCKWLNTLLNATRFSILGQYTEYRGGTYNYGSPIWADVREYFDSTEHTSYYQIFGHSQQKENPVITEHWACLDCRKMFSLDLETGEIKEA